MKRAYATILTSEEFYEGIRVLYKSLRIFSTEEFVVFLSENISTETEDKLISQGMKVIRTESPKFDEDMISVRQKADRWNKTLFKLVIFKEFGFDKLIYLDSDLLIRKNIDELFDNNCWSAVLDKDFYPECGRSGINAGVMVIEPSDFTYRKLVALVSEVAVKQNIFGDQDVINLYLSKNDISFTPLDRAYNTCFYSLKRKDKPVVVHFIFESKPWMWSRKTIICKILKYFVLGKYCAIKVLFEYYSI